MEQSLSEKVALVTGSTKGIGRAAALALADAGASVVVTGRSDGHGEGTISGTVTRIREGGGRAIGVRCDLREASDVADLVASTQREFGRLDVLVNNAGIFAPAVATAEMSVAWWDEVLDTNLRAVFLTCREALPLMRCRGGSIINMTSLAAEYGFPTGLVDAAYSTSKQAVNRFTLGLAEEVRGDGIAVNALSPVRVRSEGVLARWGDTIDLSDYAEPDAIAEVVLFLARQRSSFTGHVVRRDQFVNGAYRPDAAPRLETLFPPTPSPSFDTHTNRQRAARGCQD